MKIVQNKLNFWYVYSKILELKKKKQNIIIYSCNSYQMMLIFLILFLNKKILEFSLIILLRIELMN